MVERYDWDGKVSGRPSKAELKLIAPLRQGSEGETGAFLGLADDGERYWIKPVNNGQGQRVIITDQIVGRAGQLIDAPTCVVSTIEIIPELAGWEFRRGYFLEPGIAHASLHVEGVVETLDLDHRTDDDNSVRHAAIFALYDWCWGHDPQWLMQLTNENRFFSHDHGWFFPPPGPSWSARSLEGSVDLARELDFDRSGVSLLASERVAHLLDTIDRQNIVTILNAVPSTWPVTDEELDSVGFFLERRAPAVATRLRQRVGGSR